MVPALAPSSRAPHAGAIDHDLGLDVARRGANPDRPAILDHDLGHGRVFEDSRPPAARALGQRLRGVDRVGLAVLGQVNRADHVVDADQRPELPGALRAEHIDLQAETARHGGAALEFLEALLGGGDRNRADLAEAGRLPGLLFERGVELGRILGKAGQVVRGAQLAHETGGMPGGAAGEGLALEEDDVGAAPQREMIG